MIQIVKVGFMGEEKKGVSSATGKEWRSESMVFEWSDGTVLHRVWGTLFNETIDDFNEQRIK